jgi:uncharacterized protein (TIRG00374 family)
VPHQRNRSLAGLRIVALVLGALLLLRVLGAADARRVGELIAAVGVFGVALVLLPQLASLALESLGWQRAFRLIGCQPAFASLLRVRLATEALSQSLPAGALICESVKPLLLGRRCGLSVEASVAGMAARKYLLALSQSAYVFVLALLGFDAAQRVSHDVIQVDGLGFVGLVAGASLLGLALVMRQVFGRGRAAERVLQLVKRLPFERARRFGANTGAGFQRTDRAMERFFSSKVRELAAPALLFLGGWLLESLETWLILRLLGIELGFVEVASFEVLLSFLRNVLFVLPAGLGVQDLGYVTFLAALGVPDAVNAGAAFVVLKRTKELFWIGVGYTLLGFELKPPKAVETAGVGPA